MQKKINEKNPAVRQEPQITLHEEAHADGNKRHFSRTSITGIARTAQRTKLIVLDREHPPIPCKILDASAGGYRVSVQAPVPAGALLALEHTDGKRRPVLIAWTGDHELGLRIVEEE